MTMTGIEVTGKKAIIDRKVLWLDISEKAGDLSPDALRAYLLDTLKAAHVAGTLEVRSRLESSTINGRLAVRSLSFLMDQVLRILYDTATTYIYPLSNPTAGEKMCLVATGGYGRGMLAPFSDVDLLFLLPYKATPWAESVAEYMLYMLWDMGLKVGHATRNVDDCVRLAKQDLTIRTSLLESRYIWGEQELYLAARQAFRKQVVDGTGPEFVEAKLEERNIRHARLGDSRYVVEPNLKEGKGGLRDLQTLFWIGKYLYGVDRLEQFTDVGILTDDELHMFTKASNFLWTVRCHLHFLVGRAEERLTFDVQTALAEKMRYKDHPGASAVERFMKHYFLNAKCVGEVTRIFCASLEARHQKRRFLRMPSFSRRRKVEGFTLSQDRLSVPSDTQFEETPADMVRIFAVAGRLGRDIHPDTLKLIRRSLFRIRGPERRDPDTNKLFLDILTDVETAEDTLRMMNEAGVLGKFIPDFGRVVAQTQHDMYHHYTVDEHTIRAIGLLTRIERGELEADHPLSTGVIGKVISRRVLYLAVLLHDIAKGRGGDHSVLGAEIAERLCPRLGLDAAETETVAWLVRRHLLMSHFAFKRDLTDARTILDFAAEVQSPERLRLLLVLTVVDIRAVGPGIWNGWKGQLLRDLYRPAEEVLLLGHMEMGREERVKAAKETLAERLGDWTKKARTAHAKRFFDSYWIAEDADSHERNARLMAAAEKEGLLLAVSSHVEDFQARTRVVVFAEDHPGLFARVSGALALAGANIVDAKIFTTRDGMALDSFAIQDMDGKAFDNRRKLKQLETIILDTLAGKIRPRDHLNKVSILKERTAVFKVEPRVLIDNTASNRFTVIEVNARDRSGLLFDLAESLFRSRVSITSAHVATYGERAVDVFYCQDLFGQQIDNKVRLKNIEARLLEAAEGRKPDHAGVKAAKSTKSPAKKPSKKPTSKKPVANKGGTGKAAAKKPAAKKVTKKTPAKTRTRKTA